MSDSSAQAERELKRFTREQKICEDAEEAARDRIKALLSRRPQNRQRQLTEVFTIPFWADPTADQLKELYDDIFERYQSICSMSVPGVLYDGTHVEVPVTVPNYIEEMTYHIIAMQREDGAIAEILVDESNNYVVGFRVYLNELKKETACWCTFEHAPTLPDYFQPCVQVNYSINYSHIDKISLGDGIMPSIFTFLMTFGDDPKQQSSEEGKIYFQTLFLLYGEGPRFRIAQDWAQRQVRNPIPQRPPREMCDVFRQWSAFSKCCFRLHLYGVEIRFLDELTDDEKESSPFAGTLKRAKKLWISFEDRYKNAGMVFRRGDGKITLESLVGGEILLLNHDYKLCTRIDMREAGYTGRWHGVLKGED